MLTENESCCVSLTRLGLTLLSCRVLKVTLTDLGQRVLINLDPKFATSHQPKHVSCLGRVAVGLT